MRCAGIRIGTSLTTALITAAAADLMTESAENLGWLGGSVRDAQHESVVPTLLIGLAIGIALAVCVAFARVAVEDPLLHRVNCLRARITDLLMALGGSALCAVAMEGYETHFGGVSPFDPRSVICSHAPALLLAFILVAPIVLSIVSAALRLATHVGERATCVLVRFVHKRLMAKPLLPSFRIPAFVLHFIRRHANIANAACGLRAPPYFVRSRIFIT